MITGSGVKMKTVTGGGVIKKKSYIQGKYEADFRKRMRQKIMGFALWFCLLSGSVKCSQGSMVSKVPNI